GTFDASVVELTGDELEVVSTGGDNFLGGLDFDERLARSLIDTLEPDAKAHLESSRVGMQRVREAAEAAKIALSDQDVASVHVSAVSNDTQQQPVDLRAAMTRLRLEELTTDLVERTAEVTRVVLEAARVQPGALDEVLLVGGQSRAPLVRRRIEQVL